MGKKKEAEKKKQKDSKELKKTMTYTCPKCKSNKVKRVINFWTLFGLKRRYKCEKCGFEERIFPLLESKRDKKSR